MKSPNTLIILAAGLLSLAVSSTALAGESVDDVTMHMLDSKSDTAADVTQNIEVPDQSQVEEHQHAREHMDNHALDDHGDDMDSQREQMDDQHEDANEAIEDSKEDSRDAMESTKDTQQTPDN
ncbi:MAG: hypothetical protein P8009_07755 [Gammaproteobacteria bacterium]